MSQMTKVRRWSGRKVLALFRPDLTIELLANFAPSVNISAGRVLGRITNAANDVQTVSASGTVSGGTYKITLTDPNTLLTFTTAALAFGANAATVQTAVNDAIGAGKLTAGAGALPGTPMTLTGAGDWANKPIPAATIDNTAITGGGSLGVAHTTTGRSNNTLAAYDDTHSDGTQTAVAIAPYDIATDAAGNITLGSQTPGYHGESDLAVPVYVCGYFDTSILLGLDAAAVTDLGKIISGSLTQGIIWIGG